MKDKVPKEAQEIIKKLDNEGRTTEEIINEIKIRFNLEIINHTVYKYRDQDKWRIKVYKYLLF